MTPQPKTTAFRIKLDFTDGGESPPLQAYAFTAGGAAIGSAPVEKSAATIPVPTEFDGRMLEVILGPRPGQGQTEPTAASLRRMGGYAKSTRFLAERAQLELAIPSVIFPGWCVCLVRGRLVKRMRLPDGSIGEQPVCNARVHICEVDRLPWIIWQLPEPEIWRLRDDLLEKLRRVPIPFPKPEPGPWPGPWPGPEPGPDPGPRPPMHGRAMRAAATGHSHTAERHQHGAAARMQGGQSEAAHAAHAERSSAALSAVADLQPYRLAALATPHSSDHLRSQLVELSSLILIYLCDLWYLWHWFRVDELTTVYADDSGRFSRRLFHDCSDQPDLYLWVEQFRDGAWHTVYRPSIGCGTYWNYVCGTEIVLNLPGAVACEEPTYDVPPGVTLFVLPYAIGNTPIWGIPLGAPAAPDGWLRADGYLDYYSDSSLGMLHDAPFARTLNFIHDDSYFIPSSGIKYYRYSYRRLQSTPNTGAADPTWTPIATSLARGYRMEYNDGTLPTYEAYPVGPATIGGNSGLFEFKPQIPPERPIDPPTTIVREWTSGNLSEVAASWDTMLPAPPLSADNSSDDAGDFEVKIEVFSSAGAQVMPGAGTFRFLARHADGTTTRLATAAEEAGGAYVFRVHVDNNGSTADLPQPSIGGVAATDDCGFLRYEPGDSVRVRYLAAHPNDHAVFGFGIKRGSNWMPSATTTTPYVEVAAASAPTGSSPYVKVGDYYQRDFTPAELVGTCVDAAFAASLGVYGKATNGYHRLGLDASGLIAFALAEEEDEA